MKRNKLNVFFIVLGLTTFFESTVIAQNLLYQNTFPLGNVKLLDGPFKNACDLNIHVLLKYDVDRLLAPYLKEAGLNPKAKSFSNWIGLDGHVGGHYLSALAIHYAATGNMECKERMEYMLSELKRCQQKNENGYVGGVPSGKELWEEIKKGNTSLVWKYWVPWYNVHKMYAGLRDAWLYGGNQEARQMFLEFCDWGISVVDKLDDIQMESMLANEFGGMNEVYADAYQVTGDQKYLRMAKRFSHKEIFDSMARKKDNLDNKHANTQVPKAVGYQRVAELTKDPQYVTASRFFWETVVHNRSLSFGGNSRREHFPAQEDISSYMEEREGPESCNTNNMLKLTEGLFRMEPQAKYMDFYERAMYNHILSTQHPEHGGYVYFTPARPAHYRVYSAPNSAMWCCVGTGMENHGKYGEMIYSHTKDSLFVNLFVASQLSWNEKGLTLTQHTKFPEEDHSTLQVNIKKPVQFTLLVRYPGWVGKGEMTVMVNGKNYAMESSPSSYVTINRKWRDGDIVEIRTPMKVTLEELNTVPDYVSILCGPILMGAKAGTQDLRGLIADDSRWAHIASGSLVSVFETPHLIGKREDILKKLNNMQPVADKPLSYTVPALFAEKNKDIVLEPFYRIHDSRYMIYWLAADSGRYQQLLEEKKKDEQEKLELDRRTVDAVKTGEQQPEVDHVMKDLNSHRGIHQQVAWREAREDGYFQYELNTREKTNLSLMMRYWGNEKGNKAFDILIDDKVLIEENVVDKWGEGKFVNKEYRIPVTWLRSKNFITVKFRPKKGNSTARIFYVRLLDQER